QFLGSKTCAGCHSKIVRDFGRTPMAQTSGTLAAAVGRFVPQRASFFHSPSGYKFVVSVDNDANPPLTISFSKQKSSPDQSIAPTCTHYQPVEVARASTRGCLRSVPSHRTDPHLATRAQSGRFPTGRGSRKICEHLCGSRRKARPSGDWTFRGARLECLPHQE